MNQVARAEAQNAAVLSNVSEVGAEVLAQVVLNGDLSNLPAKDRVAYYNAVCRSVGLNPFTQPFEYLRLNGKTVLYAKRTCSDQLRQIHGVNLTITDKRIEDDLFIVSVQATNARGRRDEDLGAVTISGLRGEAKANAILKAITKAKRRVTLSICGLGMMDETEATDVAGAQFGAAAIDVQAERREGRPVALDAAIPTLDVPAERAPVAPDTLRAVAEQVRPRRPEPSPFDDAPDVEMDEDREKAAGFIQAMRGCKTDVDLARLTGSRGSKTFLAWMKENRPDLAAEIADARGQIYEALIAASPEAADAPDADPAEQERAQTAEAPA